MQVGNARYRTGADIPETVPVFPLKGALLLPGGQLPLNIFEPRYLAMVENALAGKRIIGMIQPKIDGEDDEPTDELDESLRPQLSSVGCLGRITTFAETGDGRLLITLQGICRFRVREEINCRQPYRQCRIMPFLADLEQSRSHRRSTVKPCWVRSGIISRRTIWKPIGIASRGQTTRPSSMRSPSCRLSARLKNRRFWKPRI